MLQIKPSQLTSRAIYAITLILGGTGIVSQNAAAQAPVPVPQQYEQTPPSQTVPAPYAGSKSLSYEGFYVNTKEPVYMTIRGPLEGRLSSYLVFLAKTTGEKNDQIKSVEIFLMDPTKPTGQGRRQGPEALNRGTYQLIRIGQKSDGEVGHEDATPSYVLNAKAAYPLKSPGVQSLNIFKNCNAFQEMSFDLVSPGRGSSNNPIVFKGACSERAIMGYKSGDYFAADSKEKGGIRITASPLDSEGEAQITFPGVAGLNGPFTIREKLDSIYTLRQEFHTDEGIEQESSDRKIVLFAQELDWLCRFLPKRLSIPGSDRKFGLCQAPDVMMLINPKKQWMLELLSYARFQ